MIDEDKDEGTVVSGRSFKLLLLGLALVFIGIVIIVATVVLGGAGSIGGVILIGPIPIVFGSGPQSVWLITIGAVITVISLVLFFILNRRTRRFS